VKALTERIELEIVAVDNASGVVAAASDKIAGTLKTASLSYKDLAVGVSGAATAGFSLYMAYDSVEKAGVQVDRAQLMVTSSANTAEKAQTAYNEAVSKYGATSAEAQQKATDLGIANDRAALATERAGMAENNYNNTIARGALSVLPAVITMAASLTAIKTTLTAATGANSVAEVINSAAKTVSGTASTGLIASEAALATAKGAQIPILAANTIGETASTIAKTVAIAPTIGLGAAMWNLTAAILANPITWVVVAIVGFATAVYLAYTQCKPFTEAINSVGSAIMSALKPAIDVIVGGLTWLWNNVLVPLGNFIMNTFILDLQAAGAVIKWLADGIGALASWFGDAWAAMTGTMTEHVQAKMDERFKIIEDGLKKETDAINKAADKQVVAVESTYATETDAAVTAWEARLNIDAKGWDKVLKLENDNADKLVSAVQSRLKDQTSVINDAATAQIDVLQSGYDKQIAGINAFYDEMISVTQDKLNGVQSAREDDLNALELGYLLEKQAIEAASDNNTLAAGEGASRLADLEATYTQKKASISEGYRTQELSAEIANKANILNANTLRAPELVNAKQIEADAEATVISTKNTQIANLEKAATVEIAGINRTRNDVIKEIEAERLTMETQHSFDLYVIASKRELALNAIAAQGEKDRLAIAGAFPGVTPAPTGVAPTSQTPSSNWLPVNGSSSVGIPPNILIPHLASGAVVTGPILALIGENGAERVEPLSAASSQSKDRTQYNTLYVTLNIGNISKEYKLEEVEETVIDGVVKAVDRMGN
jgi:hypothetical protein